MATTPPPKKIFTRPGTQPAAPAPAASKPSGGGASPPKLKFTRPTQAKVTVQAGRGPGGEARGAAAAAGTVRVGSKSSKKGRRF